MSLEHSPARQDPTSVTGLDGLARGPPDASDYWQALIDEKAAAAFCDLSERTIQGYRYRGGGPKYCRLSARCVKYRRLDLRLWVEERLRTSTSDPGPEAA